MAFSWQRIPTPRGMALQARVNLETMQPDGSVKAAGGVLSAYDPPSGPGVRVDGYGYAGYRTNPRFDSLLAKVIVHGRGGFAQLAGKAVRALAEFRLACHATGSPQQARDNGRYVARFLALAEISNPAAITPAAIQRRSSCFS